MDDRVVGELRAVPAPVAVHRVVAAGDRGHAAARLAQPALRLGHVGRARVRRGVAPVGERVQHDVGHLRPRRELDAGVQVVEAGVHAALRHQAEQVQPPAGAARLADLLQHGVVEERPVGDRVLDAGEVLTHHGPRAQVEVAHLGVAHLPVRQAHGAAAGGELRVPVAGPELVEVRRARLLHRVARTGGREAPAVQHDETDRRQRRSARPGGEGHRAAAATSRARLSGSRLAPPTSAPSTSGCARISAALSGFTLPP